ncbi:Uncharacterised protein [Halioglobus japonicus]|nr:Uncharacterised protein [Halioglobus japonicus]
MKNRFSFANCAACYLFSCLLFFGSSAHAGLLRYDIVYNEEHLGHMVFDAQIGALSQNLWTSLVDWTLGWDEVVLDRSNSVAANASSRFFIDAVGNVINDGMEEIICTGSLGCAPELVVTDNPVFEGSDGSSIGFSRSAIAGGMLTVTSANGDVYRGYRPLVYTGPFAVPLPATIWLLVIALYGLGVTRHRAR